MLMLNTMIVTRCQVYGCGQPTLAGFGAALEKLAGKDKSAPVIWINMRQVGPGQELLEAKCDEVGASDAYEGCRVPACLNL